MVADERIRVYVAENLRFELDLIERLLTHYPDLNVVGKNHILQNLIEEICRMELPPEVVLMDIDFGLREMDGLTALEKIKRHNKSIKFIMMTIHDTPELPFLAFRDGAEGFLYRGLSGGDRFLNAIRAVHSGLLVWDDEAFRRARDWRHSFRPIERRILIELAKRPSTSAELAERLSLTTRSVENYLQDIMNELDIHRRDLLGNWAKENLRLIG
jgi:two-component system nitrate/nitrite response regulator NarL